MYLFRTNRFGIKGDYFYTFESSSGLRKSSLNQLRKVSVTYAPLTQRPILLTVFGISALLSPMYLVYHYDIPIENLATWLNGKASAGLMVMIFFIEMMGVFAIFHALKNQLVLNLKYAIDNLFRS